MPALVTSKFDEVPIKIEGTIDRSKFKYGLFRHSRASNSEVNSLIWPEFEVILDFMVILVTCKFDEDPIKSDVALLRTTFLSIIRPCESFLTLKGK